MFTLGAYMLVFRCYTREQSNVQLLAVSLRVMLISADVFSRQTLCILGCGVYGLHLTRYTTHHGWIPGNVKNGKQMYRFIYDQDRSDEK